MQVTKLAIQAVIVGAWIFSAGCSSSNFGASPGAKAAGPAVAPAVAPASGNVDGATAPATPPSIDVSNSGGTAGHIGDSNDCSGGTPMNYNILMAFDKSGSQAQTDPTNVRGTGGQAFVDQFSAYLAANPTAQVHMNVVSFNTGSTHGANGWQALNPDHAALIKQDITTATSNPDGNTAYTPVLTDAAALFTQINAQTAGSNARNYLIFLTDGLPNADNQLLINLAVNNVVSKNAAIIAIASGPDVPANGEAVVKALALPAKGATYPDLVGQYYRAATPDDLKNVWSQLSAKIANSCATSAMNTGGTNASGT